MVEWYKDKLNVWSLNLFPRFAKGVMPMVFVSSIENVIIKLFVWLIFVDDFV